MSDEENEFVIWFGNENANKISSDSEESRHSDIDKLNTKLKKSKTAKASSSEICPFEIKWIREEENKLQKRYGKESRSSIKRQVKLTKELKVKISKIDNIDALSQCHCDLSINSRAIFLIKLAETSESQLSEVRNSICHLPDILCGSPSFLSKHQIKWNQHWVALKDMSWLLQFVIQ